MLIIFLRERDISLRSDRIEAWNEPGTKVFNFDNIKCRNFKLTTLKVVHTRAGYLHAP